MTIQLADEQQRALDADRETPHRVIGSRSTSKFVLVPEEDYETIRELLEDEQERRAILNVAVRSAVGRMDDEP